MKLRLLEEGKSNHVFNIVVVVGCDDDTGSITKAIYDDEESPLDYTIWELTVDEYFEEQKLDVGCYKYEITILQHYSLWIDDKTKEECADLDGCEIIECKLKKECGRIC